MPRRYSQPPGAARIDQAIPISKTIRADWSFATATETLTNKLPTLSSAYTSKKAGKSGTVLSVSGSAALDRAILNCGTADNIGSGDFTVAIRFVYRGYTGAAAYAALGRWNTGASPSTCDWYIGAGGTFGGGSTADFVVAVGSNTYTASASSVTWTVGNEYTLVGRRIGTTIYVDCYNHTTGVLKSGSTTDAGITTVNYNSGSRTLKLGEIDAGPGYNTDLDVSYVRLHGTGLANSVLPGLYANPWFVYEGNTLTFPATTGGSVTLVIANASQAQTAGSLSLTTEAYLTIANAAQAQTAQNLTLSTDTSVTLSVQSAVQLQIAGNIVLTSSQWLAIANAVMGQTAQNVVLWQDTPAASSAVIGVDSTGKVYCILTARGTRLLVDAGGEPYAMIDSPIVIAISKTGRLISLA